MNYVVNIVLRSGDSGLTVRTQPEHLDLHIGDRVIWQCHVVDTEQDVDFRMLFGGGSPFLEPEYAAAVRAGNMGVVQSPPAQETGDFKYDVKASRPTGAALAEEDPFLHVRF